MKVTDLSAVPAPRLVDAFTAAYQKHDRPLPGVLEECGVFLDLLWPPCGSSAYIMTASIEDPAFTITGYSRYVALARVLGELRYFAGPIVDGSRPWFWENADVDRVAAIRAEPDVHEMAILDTVEDAPVRRRVSDWYRDERHRREASRAHARTLPTDHRVGPLTVRTEAANAAMQGVLERVRARDATEIDPDLAAYLDDGLSLGPDRSIVAIASARHAYAERGQFEDLVGYEAFANKIHVDDWGERLHHAPVDEQLSQALLLAERVGQLAAQLGVVVAVIISIDVGTESVVFRFHGMRPDELPWLAADLEGYQEPVLLRIYR